MTEPTAADDEERTVVYLGNRNAVTVLNDPDDDHATALAEGRAIRQIREPVDGYPKRCTTIKLEPGLSFLDQVTTIKRLWPRMSDDPAPAWVASTDPELTAFLAREWTCEVRDPEPDHESSEPRPDAEEEA